MIVTQEQLLNEQGIYLILAPDLRVGDVWLQAGNEITFDSVFVEPPTRGSIGQVRVTYVHPRWNTHDRYSFGYTQNVRVRRDRN